MGRGPRLGKQTCRVSVHNLLCSQLPVRRATVVAMLLVASRTLSVLFLLTGPLTRRILSTFSFFRTISPTESDLHSIDRLCRDICADVFAHVLKSHADGQPTRYISFDGLFSRFFRTRCQKIWPRVSREDGFQPYTRWRCEIRTRSSPPAHSESGQEVIWHLDAHPRSKFN